MSDTPRTEPYKGRWATYCHNDISIFELASELERELAAVTDERDNNHQRAEEIIAAREKEIRRLRAERDALRARLGLETRKVMGAEKRIYDLKVERTALREDKSRLDWLEEQQVAGEWIHHAIHWDGRRIRAAIDEAKGGI